MNFLNHRHQFHPNHYFHEHSMLHYSHIEDAWLNNACGGINQPSLATCHQHAIQQHQHSVTGLYDLDGRANSALSNSSSTCGIYAADIPHLDFEDVLSTALPQPCSRIGCKHPKPPRTNPQLEPPTCDLLWQQDQQQHIHMRSNSPNLKTL
eukprot:GHUV01047537.1.p1 GENE.GHUV01047537.1~~GHUV01047537.1.p1  ORF type:complete len:151 (-),score=13.09 GHUV01047537.1:1122-1574(-)